MGQKTFAPPDGLVTLFLEQPLMMWREEDFVLSNATDKLCRKTAVYAHEMLFKPCWPSARGGRIGMSWRRRRRPWWSDFFEDIFEEFERIDEIFRRFWEELPSWREVEENVKVYGPYVYGFSISIGPDGKPVVREFGNVRPTRFGPRFVEEREPLVDVAEEDDEVVVVAELPGVEKEDIELNATEKELIISVDTERRKYYKRLELPAEVDPKSARASYRNGILEVRLKKVRPERRGERIKIE